MPVSQGFLAFVLDQLDGCGRITSRRMFGGAGLYASDVFFGIIADDVLYLRMDPAAAERKKRARLRPFKPYADSRSSRKYFQVPLAVLEDPAELSAWAREAIAAARRART